MTPDRALQPRLAPTGRRGIDGQQAKMKASMRRSPSDSLVARLRRAHEGDELARESVILEFMPLARTLARRYARSSLAFEDLVQVANLALVKAIDRFDPSFGNRFETYATPTILGELRRHFRDCSWAVHVVRRDQERAKLVQDGIEALSREQGRPPSVQQLALYLELSEEDVLDGLQIATSYAAGSLDAPLQSADVDPEPGTLSGSLGSREEGYARSDDRMMLATALACLTDRELRLLRLRFGAELTQSQIGELLGVSQMQVSRLLSQTFAKLRDCIGETTLPC